MNPAQGALLLTGPLLLTLLALGLRLQLGLPGAARRWHHLLFFAVCVGTLAAGILAGQRGLWLLPALLLLLLMPLTKPGRPGHWRLALLSALAFGWGAYRVLT